MACQRAIIHFFGYFTIVQKLRERPADLGHRINRVGQQRKRETLPSKKSQFRRECSKVVSLIVK